MNLYQPGLYENFNKTLTIFLKKGSSYIFDRALPLHKILNFPLRTSSVNANKSAGNFEFGHIYRRNT